MIDALNRKQRRALKRQLQRPPKKRHESVKQEWWSLPAEAKDHLSLLAHGYLESFRIGEAKREHFSGLRSMCRVAYLAASAHHPDHSHIAQKGLDAIAAIEARHTRTGKWDVSGPESTALGDALQLMDQLMVVVRRVDMARHVKAVLGV